MSIGQSAESGPRAIHPYRSFGSPSHAGSIGPQLAADWRRILRDLTACGTILTRVGNNTVTLQSLFEPASADANDHTAWLAGPGSTLAGLSQRWAHAAISRSCHGGQFDRLDIHDHLGAHQLSISLTEASARERFNASLAKQWAARPRPASLPDAEQLSRRLSQLQHQVDRDAAEALQRNWYDAAHPRRPGRPVDTSLLAPFLETLGDQVFPLKVLVGNAAVIQYYVTALYDFRQTGPVIRLRNRSSEIQIDCDRVVAAFIVDARPPMDERWLQLFDRQHHCVAAFSIAPNTDPADRGLWQSLLRALAD